MLGHGNAFWREKGRQDCTFILIQTKGVTRNSFQASLSLPLKFAAVVGFPALHRDAAWGATFMWPSLAVTAPTHWHVPVIHVPARCLTQECVSSHPSTAHGTLQLISAQKWPR